jgi:hypothetical protein
MFRVVSTIASEWLKAFQDLGNMMRYMLADSNVPNIYWDFVVEHAALVNSMIMPSICNKTKTIFEAVWDVIPNIDLVPPVIARQNDGMLGSS